MSLQAVTAQDFITYETILATLNTDRGSRLVLSLVPIRIVDQPRPE